MLGGDINQDLSKNEENKRTRYLNTLVSEVGLKYTCAGNTFTNSYGIDCSEIEYFLYKIPDISVLREKTILYPDSCVSHHYPIQLTQTCEVRGKSAHKGKPESVKLNRKVIWRKIDKEQ